MKIETDIIRQIYNKDGNFLTVRPWPESPYIVSISAVGKGNEEYFGEITLTMDSEFAKQVGEALIACAKEVIDK